MILMAGAGQFFVLSDFTNEKVRKWWAGGLVVPTR